MITIREDISKKVSGYTSLFVSFNYDERIIEIIKYSCEIYKFDKKDKVWEIPTIYLSFLLDNLTELDDIKVIPYKIENKEEKIGNYPDWFKNIL